MEVSAVKSELLDVTVKALLQDLDTDWLPDPWSFAELPAEIGRPLRLSDDPADLMSLTVALIGGRMRSVPILDPWTSASFQQAASTVLRVADPVLAPGVLAYRLIDGLGIEHYRSALLRRCDSEYALAKERPVALMIDLESFFPSISLELLTSLLEAIPGWETLRPILAAFNARYGYPLPEGYGAARSLANIVLHPLDEVISVPFVRWVDDYKIFCKSHREAEKLLEKIRRTAGDLGFRVSETKSTIRPSKDVSDSVISVIGHSLDELKTLSVSDLLGHGQTTERTLRFALRMAAEERNGTLLEVLADVDGAEIPGSAMPRLAWLLAVTPWNDASTSIVRGLASVDDALAPWRIARLAAALWYAPTSIASGLLDDFRRVFEENIAVRPVIARSFARHRVEGLDDLLGLAGNASSARAAVLAATEISHDPTSSPIGSSGASWLSGPPVRTYL